MAVWVWGLLWVVRSELAQDTHGPDVVGLLLVGESQAATPEAQRHGFDGLCFVVHRGFVLFGAFTHEAIDEGLEPGAAQQAARVALDQNVTVSRGDASLSEGCDELFAQGGFDGFGGLSSGAERVRSGGL